MGGLRPVSEARLFPDVVLNALPRSLILAASHSTWSHMGMVQKTAVTCHTDLIPLSFKAATQNIDRHSHHSPPTSTYYITPTYTTEA